MKKDNYIGDTSLTLLKFSFLLLLATSIARLSSSLYLPSLLQIGVDLGLSDHLLGETLSIFFIFFSISTLFVGPLVDSYGRKNMIMAGSLIFIFGSLLCANSYSWESLMIGRVFQAMGASALPVAARAMIRDLCDDKQVISVLGWMALLGGLLPIVAPILGGFIIKVLDWRYTFWFLVLFATISLSIIIFQLPYSIPKDKKQRFRIKKIFKDYIFILSSAKFLVVIIPLALAFAIQGAYLVTSPFIFMKHFELTPIEYGVTNTVVVISLFAGRYIASYTIEKKNIYVAYVLGAFFVFLGGVFLNVLMYLDMDRLPLIIFALFIAIGGFGILLPIGVKSIMSAFKEKAGTASGLHGFLTLGSTAIGSLSANYMKSIYNISSLESLTLFFIPTMFLIVISAFFTKKYLT